MSKFEQTIKYLRDEKVFYYISGDFNIDVLKDQTNIIHYINSLFNLGCTQLITKPT